MHLTHWTSHDLARQVVADGVVDAISPRTVRQILRDVDLQPHRTRYWKTGHLELLGSPEVSAILQRWLHRPE